MENRDLTQQDTHFAFGRNWKAYAEKLSMDEIDKAQQCLARLISGHSLKGKSFLDIGSGSGVHSLAALRLGASRVFAIDIDADSVAATEKTLSTHTTRNSFEVKQASIFDFESGLQDQFDFVYCWGVLHHTGDMQRAIRCAAQLTAPGGLFVFALYYRLWVDFFWRAEKRWYANANASSQARARAIYIALFKLRLLLTGKRLNAHIAQYQGVRGMDFHHDVHDWMGGWPYESTTPQEVQSLMTELGFRAIQTPTSQGRIFGRRIGIFGSGCDEFIYQCPHAGDR